MTTAAVIGLHLLAACIGAALGVATSRTSRPGRSRSEMEGEMG